MKFTVAAIEAYRLGKRTICHSTSSSHGSPTMEDDEVDVGEVGGGAVHVEGAGVLDRLRPERHAFMHPDQVHPELLGLLEGGEGNPRIVHPPWEGLAVVIADVVELERLGAELLDLHLHQVERLLALQRVDRAPEQGAVGVTAGHLGALLPVGEPVVEEVGERQRLRHDHVGVRPLDHHLVDLVDTPLPQEVLGAEDGPRLPW